MGWSWIVVANGLLGVGGYWVARHWLGQPAGLPRALAAATLAWAWATLGVEVTGATGTLAPGSLLAWASAGATIGLAFRLRSRGPWGGLARSGGVDWEPAATLALGLVFWAALVLGLPSLLGPVKVVSDGPIYHLYFAARWWKEGRLSLIPTPFGASVAPYFPAVGDFWLTWLMAGWGGDRLAKVGQVPFLVGAACATFGIARRLGAGASASAIAAAWFVTCSPLFLFAFEPNVDMIFVAGYLTSAYFFLRYALGDAGDDALFLGGLAAGGALGTKAHGVVFVPVLLALAAGLVLARPRPTRRRLASLALIAASPLVMAGYGFARLSWSTGNPLYPLHLEAFGRTWLSGWYGTDVMRLSHYYLPKEAWGAGMDTLLAVLDPRLVPFWGASLAGAWSWGRARRPLDRWAWAFSALALLNVGLFWVLIPYRTQQRFMLHALGLAAVPLALTLERSRWLRLAASLLLALHVLTPQAWPVAVRETDLPWDSTPIIPNAIPPLIQIPITLNEWRKVWRGQARVASLLLTLGLGVAALLVAWSWGRSFRRPTPGRLVAAALMTATSAVAAGATIYPWGTPSSRLFYPPFPDYNLGWAALEALSGPKGTRVAYAGTNLPYYLMASGLRNEVRYINVDGHPGWLLHDYHRLAKARGRPTSGHPNPPWDREHPDYHAWLANLRAEQIALLVVAKSHPFEGSHNIADREGFPIERSWADAHPETFTPVYGLVERDPLFRIYRVRPLVE